MTSPGTEVLERPDVSTDETDPGDNVFHYVKKDQIAESAVMGTMVQALCGEIFPVTRAPKPGSPVCTRCQEIYEAMDD
jgi:formylmethanofuran dehydrogenase subunit E